MRLRFMDSSIWLSLIIVVLGFWELGPASPDSFAQLQGGVSSNQQLDTSDIHVGQLIISIDHEVNIMGSGLQPNAVVEGEITAELDEFSRLQGVAFRIIWRSVSELFGVVSLHARVERCVGRSSGSCDVALSADPAISRAEANPPSSGSRCKTLISHRAAMGKPVPEAWTCSARAQVT
jgi:hypothetical protein